MSPDDSQSLFPPLPEVIRQRLHARFDEWIDRMLAGEPAPAGLPDDLLTPGLEPAAPAADLFTVASSLTALGGEVRLQGRAFKQLADAVAPVADLPARVEALREALQPPEPDEADEAPVAEPESPLPPADDVLETLFDLHGRLERGVLTAERQLAGLSPPSGLLARLSGAARHSAAAVMSVNALLEGYRLTLSRLDGAFDAWGIRPIGAAGDAFDPCVMQVVEVEPRAGVADGVVLEVYRSGYELHGRLLAHARVKVARAKPAGGNGRPS